MKKHLFLMAFFSLGLFEFSLAGTLNRVETNPKQMGMAGAGSAQINDSSAMSVNPAGMAVNGDMDVGTGDFFISTGEAAALTELQTAEDAEAFALFWAKRHQSWSAGLGLYDTAAMNIDYVELSGADSVYKSTHLSAYDMTVYLALSVSDRFKLGGTLKMASVSTDYKDAGGNKLDDEVWSTRLGAKYIVFNQPLDFSTSSMLFLWQFGAAYEAGSSFKPFTVLKTHPLKNREVMVVPEHILLGSNMRFGWILEHASFVLNLNADASKETYENMSDLLIPSEQITMNRADVEITKTMLGAECLLKGASPGALTYALRAGIAQQKSNFEGRFKQTTTALGVGIIGETLSLELALQNITDTSSEETKLTNELAWSIGMGVAF